MNGRVDFPPVAEAVSPDGFLPQDYDDHRLRAALIAAGADDAWVCQRMEPCGAVTRLGFVVTERAMPPDLFADLELVPLTRLPRDADGAVDAAALARFVPGIPLTGATRESRPVAISDRPALLDGGPVPPLRDGITALPDILVEAARRVPDRGVTLLSRDGAPRLLSYAALDARARIVAAALRDRGVAPGGTVLCVFGDTEDDHMMAALWGALYAGACPVPLLAPQRYVEAEAQTRRLWDAAELLPEAVILAAGERAAVAAVLPRRKVFDLRTLKSTRMCDPAAALPASPAALFLTSGSTARPKVVPQSHEAILSLIAGCIEANDLCSQDVSLNWLPLDHVGSVIMLHLRDTYLGARQFRASGSEVLRDPLIWIDWLSEHRVTNGWAPNFAFELVAGAVAEEGARAWDLSRLRFLHNGGEAVMRKTAAAFLEALAPARLGGDVVRPAWGMSETSSGCVFNPGFDPLDEARGPIPVGRPCPGLRLRIADPEAPDRVLREGEIGQLHVSGPMVLDAYDRNPEKTRESFAAPGWFDTGDLGRVADGQLFITGRAKDVLIVNGLNLSPAEIETALGRIEGLAPASVAVLSLPDPDGGSERVAVFFAPKPGCAAKTTIAEMRQRLSAEFGLALDLAFALDPRDMPKTSIGKIQKEKLRDAALGGALAPVWSRIAEGPPAMPTLWSNRWVPSAARPGAEPLAVTLCGPEAGALGLSLSALGVAVSRVSPKALAGQEIGLVPADTVVVLPGVVTDPFDAVPIVQRLGRLCRQQPTRLIWMAPGGSMGPGCQPAMATLAALLRSAEAEYPGLGIRLVDPGKGPIDAARLRDEIGEIARQPEIRWTPRAREALAHARVTATPGSTVRLRKGARYLVTGGLGGIGQALAGMLQERWDAELVILGRRSEAALDAQAARALAALRAGGAVGYHACDLSAPGAEAVLEGLGCDGIFHLAGQAAACALDTCEAGRMAADARAKIAGTDRLCAAAGAMGADWLVAFGSVNGTFGGAGYAGYAMANRYQQARAGASGACRIVTLNWSMWDGTGVSAGFGDTRLVRQKGFDVMTVSRALAALEPALASGCDTVQIGLDPACPAMARHLLERPERICATPETAEPDRAPVPGDPVTTALCGIWQEILKLPGLPAPDDNIFDLGATSLDLPRAQERMMAAFDREIDVLDFFDHADIAGFAGLLR